MLDYHELKDLHFLSRDHFLSFHWSMYYTASTHPIAPMAILFPFKFIEPAEFRISLE